MKVAPGGHLLHERPSVAGARRDETAVADGVGEPPGLDAHAVEGAPRLTDAADRDPLSQIPALANVRCRVVPLDGGTS
ncbi:MAG: hypothetical protein ACOC9O_01670 [Myxococcota bacterium]